MQATPTPTIIRVLTATIGQAVAGSFHDLVRQKVIAPAGPMDAAMAATTTSMQTATRLIA